MQTRRASICTCIITLLFSFHLISCASVIKRAQLSLTEQPTSSDKAELVITVKDLDGERQVGALVWAIDDENNRSYKAVTDVDGNASFHDLVLSDRYTVVVYPDETRYPFITTGISVKKGTLANLIIKVVCLGECTVY